MWSELLGHGEQVEMLRRTIERGRLAHTFLFVGPAGIGKRRFALEFAQCLLCENHAESELRACGRCPGCKQVVARTHPDLLVVSCPEGKAEIPIELFVGPPERRGKAGLCYELSLRPMAGRRKIAIIDDADRLNDEGANALLKTLEEPPAHSLIVLIATTADALLPTIRSRCQVLRFAPLADGDIRQLLVREGLTDNEQEAAEVASFSGGSLATAAQLLDPELRKQRGLLYVLLAADPFQSAVTASNMLEALSEAGSESSAQRQFAGWIVSFCIEFYRQSLLRLNAPGDAARATIPQTVRFVGRFPNRTPEDIERVGQLLERSMAAEGQIAGNVSVPLCLETLFDDLGKIMRAG